MMSLVATVPDSMVMALNTKHSCIALIFNVFQALTISDLFLSNTHSDSSCSWKRHNADIDFS